MRNSGIEPFELAKSVVKVGKSNIVLLKKIMKLKNYQKREYKIIVV